MSKDPLSPLTKIKAMLESSSHRGGRPTQFQIPRENIYISKDGIVSKARSKTWPEGIGGSNNLE